MDKQFLFVANWKMNMSYARTLHYLEEYKKNLKQLTQQSSLIICPSFVALTSCAPLLHSLNIALGAQNCSQYERGAFTGEIDACSLHQIGCTYCIVGHSERRIHFNETNEIIAAKVTQLFMQNIIPIICIGETKDEFKHNKTYYVLEKQLCFIREVIATQKNTTSTCIIAYEPVWSIGTGILPEKQYLSEIFSWLNHFIHQHFLPISIYFLYGGSVDPGNAIDIMQIPHVDGFLIGGASLDFQKFSNIVLLKR